MNKLTILMFLWIPVTLTGCNCGGSNGGGDGGMCIAAGQPCSTSTPCCGGACNGSVCTASTFCKAAGDSCTARTECCLGTCMNGTCGSQVCKDVGAACGAGA